MPIPFLIAGVAIAMGAAGAGLGAKGGYDQHRAKMINDESNMCLENAARRLEDQRIKCSKSITVLGEEKLNVLSGSIRFPLVVLANGVTSSSYFSNGFFTREIP